MYTVRHNLCCIKDEWQTGKEVMYPRRKRYQMCIQRPTSFHLHIHTHTHAQRYNYKFQEGSPKIEPECPKNQICQTGKEVMYPRRKRYQMYIQRHTHRWNLQDGSPKTEPVCPKNRLGQAARSALVFCRYRESGAPWFCSLFQSKGRQEPHMTTAKMVTQ